MASFENAVAQHLGELAHARAQAAPPAAAAITAEELQGIALHPGARVLDRITGQEGTVQNGRTVNDVVSTPQAKS